MAARTVRVQMDRRLLYPIIACFLATLALAVVGMLYTNNVVRDQQREWCDLVATLDAAYRRTPPQTDTGRRVAKDVHDLVKRLDCGATG